MSNKVLLSEVLLELKKRQSKQDGGIFDTKFPEQDAFVKDKSRFIAALCTRRAGKSHGLGLKFINAAKKHKNALCPYIGLTRDSCYNIMWPIFKDLDQKYKLGLQFKESKLEITTPDTSSTIKLFGADQKGFIDRLRGSKYPFAAIDEGQAFKSHIETLVDDILTPAIADYEQGQIAVTGTPAPVPKGYFYDLTCGKYGFNSHHWTVYNNPYFPKPKEFVADLFEKKGWTEANPTYRREWLGEWVADLDALVYKFNPLINKVDRINQSEDWTYVLGVDLGYDPDPSAFVLTAYSIYLRQLFVIEIYKQTKLTIFDVAERINYYKAKYKNIRVIIDAGGQGKMIAEEISRRYTISLHPAQKTDKEGFIELFNSDLQQGHIKLLPGCQDLSDEWMNLIWDSEKLRRVEDSRYPNHLADAALYAWRYCYNYSVSLRPEKNDPSSLKAVDDWWMKQEQLSEEQKNREKEENFIYG